jgi:AraC family transcriptional regulator
MLVIRGGACPVFRDQPLPKFQKRHLWVVPPYSTHTWKHDPSTPCEVIVAHFASLPLVMDSFISRTHPTSVPISPRDLKVVEQLYDKMLPEYRKPRLTSSLIFEQCMLEYCLLIIRNLEKSPEVSGFDVNATKVQQALLWHQDHLSEGIMVSDVAAALHISEAHLRRIFEAVMGKTPKEVFQQAALEKACRLMAETSFSLKEIAFKSGYRGFSQFYRAFRNHYQQAPEAWRKNSAYGELGLKVDRK